MSLYLDQYKAFIFDVDGTLVRSNHLHAAAWKESLDKFYKNIPKKLIRSLIGMGGDKILPRLAGVREESPIGKKISKYRAELFKRRFTAKIKAFPKTADLVKYLIQNGCKVGIASSASRADLLKTLEIAKVRDLVTVMVSSDDVKLSKPDPDCINQAIKKLKLPKAKIIYVGDTPYDIEAAARAGLGAIGLLSGGSSRSELSGACALFKDPAHLLKALKN